MAVARDGVGVAPSVPFAVKSRRFPFSSQTKVLLIVHPGLVLVAEHRPHVAGFGVGQQDVVGVLQPVQVLEDQLLGVRRPVHAGDIGVAWIAGRLHPAGRTARRADDADPHRGIGLPGLRIADIS